MKIISNDECYIHRKDIEYITNYVPLIDEEIKLKLNSLDGNGYIHVTDRELINFILNNEFLVSFNYLFGLSYSMLDNMALRLRIEINDIEHEEDCLSSDGDRILYREKKRNLLKNKEYLLSQIISMMEYKKGKSMCDFPNIPNPCINSIVSDDMVASLSLIYDNILIHRINSNLGVSPEFCSVAYRMFMHDRYGSLTDEIEINQRMTEDKKYVCVSGINLENIENNNNERKL